MRLLNKIQSDLNVLIGGTAHSDVLTRSVFINMQILLILKQGPVYNASGNQGNRYIPA